MGRTPRKAAFFWTGEVVPWVRWIAPISFAVHHPGWEVELHTDADLGDQPDGHEFVKVVEAVRPPQVHEELWEKGAAATKSDVWRWWWLHEHGGLYADTDVIFYGSFEPLVDKLDEEGCDCAMTLNSGYRVAGGFHLSIGLVTSQPGCQFFFRALEFLGSHNNLRGYQAAGVVALARRWAQFSEGVKVGNVPANLLYSRFAGREPNMLKVWAQGDLSPDSLALHWYGGNRFARPIDRNNWKDNYSNCPIGKAIVLGLGENLA